MQRMDVYFRAMLLAACTCVLAGCAVADMFSPEAKLEREVREKTQGMLNEILVSGKPQGFDEINVSDTVAGHFPVGTRKAAVMQAFKGLEGVLVYDDAPDTLLVRYDKGKAMFDVDPRTVLATFSFDSNGMLVAVRAVHIKNQ